MAKALLNIENLGVSFAQNDNVNIATQNISLQLKKGETLAIVGESGSGKSVTSLAVMKLLGYGNATILQEGKIFYKSTDITDLPLYKMESIRGNQIAMIFQEPMTSLNPLKTCGQQVIEAVLQHKNINKIKAKSLVIDLFEKVKLPNITRLYKAYPHEISGGQKQRVMIALALICEPEILIADEPTTALDVTVQKEILILLKDLQKENGMGIIFISHDLAVVSQIADNVLVMFRGQSMEYGSMKQIFHSPKHAYTKSLLTCRPPLDRYLKRLPIVSDFLNIEDEKIIPKNIDLLAFINYLTVQKPSVVDNDRYNNSPVVEVKNLSKHYTSSTGFLNKNKSTFKAVDNITFNVYPGETLGLVGESGCGKTTLSRMLLCLLPATSGTVFYDGQPILGLKQKSLIPLRKKFQIIFQDPYSSLNPKHTIGQALTEPMMVHNIGKNSNERKLIAISFLEKVGMDANVFHRYPHEFSGGQRQRIVIARALCLEPDFIICDESVSALDISVQAQVLNLLNQLKAEFNLTYIFISHDLSVVKYMSDRLLVMNKGQIEEIGPADDVFTNPSSNYTKKLIEAIPRANMPLS